MFYFLWKPWNYENFQTTLRDDDESLKTKKTEEEEDGQGKAKTLKIVSCHCMLLPACLKQRKLCCLRWIIYSESCIADKNKWGQEIKRDVGDLESAKQEIGLHCDKKLGVCWCSNVRRPKIVIHKRNSSRFSCPFSFIFVTKPWKRRQLTDLLLVTHNKGFVSESFVFLFFPIYFCCDCSGRIISWYSRKKYKSRRERNHCRGRKHKSATLRTFWAWKWQEDMKYKVQRDLVHNDYNSKFCRTSMTA